MIKRFIFRIYTLTIGIPVLGGLAFFALNLYRRLRGKPPLVYFQHRLVEALPSLPDRALYDRLTALNIVDTVRGASADVYDRLGIDIRTVAVVKLLTRARQELFAGVDLEHARHHGSVLVRFEAAWNLFQSGETTRAIETFRRLIADEALWRRARRNVYLREALARSGEIVGRDAELSGDLESALRLYQRVVALAGSGIISRRVTLMLWRQGRIRDAAVWAERALWTDQNLAAHAVKHNAHLSRVSKLLEEAGPDPEAGRN